MVQLILEMFTTAEKAEAMLASPIIELIFLALFITFVVTLCIHLALYMKFRTIRNYLKDTTRMDIEPLQSFKSEFDKRQESESITVETFVQERFSSWRIFNIPVISLIKLVQMTVSVFILLGVLGTFIGLTLSLGSINAGGDQLVENVAGVLSGIDVAFYTSIVGMSFSLIMTVLVKVFNTEYMLTDIMLRVESNLEGEEQKGLGKLIDVSEAINQSIIHMHETNEQSLQQVVQAFTGFRDYTSGLEKSARDLAAFNDGLSENLADFQELFQQMKVVTDGFSEGTAALNKNFTNLFSYFKKADRKNERIVAVFENTHEKVQEVAKSQIASLQQFEDRIEDIKQFTSTLLEEQTDIQHAIQLVSKKSQELTEIMGAHMQDFKRIFGDDLSTKLGGITTYLNELSQDFDKLGSAVVQLPEALQVVNETQIENKQLLSDRFRELKEFNQVFNQHLKNHATESMTFEKHMREATSTFEQVGMKNSQLIRDINNTVSQMNQAFNQRENQLESSVTILKDTLSQYVQNLEGTLGNKLEQVARNIGDAVGRVNEGMKRDFSDMRRVNENMQQDYARAFQQLLQELGREIQMLNRQLSSMSQQAVRTNQSIGLRQNEY
ncbi:MotA/TolQ/ExbB proton channel family protein [Virgibacillus soli]|uniref:MotA/TolQ/ExbB proton channel family protein n=1 Tax=Paracerasibacillus soli TaxID=480284 RepID=UPI0035E9B6BC